MQNKAIGVFDSGVGGLTCVKELLEILENEDIVYLGDTKRMPYGVNTKKTIIKYTINDIDFLNAKDVKIIAAACGTISSNVNENEIENLKTIYIDLINPTVKKAISLTKKKKIAIIATNSTVNSKVFDNRIKDIDSKIEVLSVACPDFVTLIEKGHINDDIINKKANEYLQKVKEFSPDVLILGCTHFPIIKETISKILGDEISLVNSGQELAKEIKNILKEKNLLKMDNEKGNAEFFATSKTEAFDNVSKIFLGEKSRKSSLAILKSRDF